MNKEEILERNRKSNKDEEDEREQYISGKAGMTAKLVLSLVVAVLAIFKHYKGMPTGDIWGMFMAYVATELLYKYYHIKNRKILLCGILAIISSVCFLLTFVISTSI